jgi:hypothetical protein
MTDLEANELRLQVMQIQQIVIDMGDLLGIDLVVGEPTQEELETA